MVAVTAAQSAARRGNARVAHAAFLAQRQAAAAATLAAGKKLCVSCGETKRLEEFNRHGRAADGLQSNCRACSVGGIQRKRENGRKAAMVAAANKRRRAAERLAAGCKRCARCDETKPLDAFPVVGPWSADGHHRMCTPCRSEQQAEWYQARQARKRAVAMVAKREELAGREAARVAAAAEAARAADAAAADRARKAALELKRQLDDAMVEASPAALAAAAARADEAALAARLAERTAALAAARQRRPETPMVGDAERAAAIAAALARFRPKPRQATPARCTEPGCMARFAAGPDRPCSEHAKLDDADMDRARNAARLYGRFVPYSYGGSAPEGAAVA